MYLDILRKLKYLVAGVCLAVVFSVRALGAGPPAEVEGVIKADTAWSGTVLVAGDVLVPDGVTLTIAPGTTVEFVSSESSKIEPMFLSMQTELLVRGVLRVPGTKDAPVRFIPAPEALNTKRPARGDWGGVIFDGESASASVVSGAYFAMADSAIATYNSSPTVAGCRIEDCGYGLVCAGQSRPRLSGCVITGCGTGIVASNGGRATVEDTTFEKNEHDTLGMADVKGK